MAPALTQTLTKKYDLRLLLNFPMLWFPQLNDGNNVGSLKWLFSRVKSETLGKMLT